MPEHCASTVAVIADQLDDVVGGPPPVRTGYRKVVALNGKVSPAKVSH